MEQEQYKNKDWLYTELVEKERSLAEIGREFKKDTTTIQYWAKKFNIPTKKEPKYSKQKYTCPVCSKEFEKRVYKNAQVIYCSQKCAYEGRTLGYTKRVVPNGYNTKPTIVTLKCQQCDNQFEVEKTNQNHKYCSRDCFLKAHKTNMAGESNPQWIDGRSYEKRCYRGANWDEQRKKCYERDNYNCQRCQRKCVGRKGLNGTNGDLLIQCHHIKKYESEEDNELKNLVTLCARCHKIVEGGGSIYGEK